MEQVNYEKLLPTEPPEDMISWLFGLGCFRRNYIVFKSAWVFNPLTELNEKKVHCVCSSCESEWYAERADRDLALGCVQGPFGFWNYDYDETVYSCDVTICPFCGVEVKALHVSSFRNAYMSDVIFPICIERIHGFGDSDMIALIAWRIVSVLKKTDI